MNTRDPSTLPATTDGVHRQSVYERQIETRRRTTRIRTFRSMYFFFFNVNVLFRQRGAARHDTLRCWPVLSLLLLLLHVRTHRAHEKRKNKTTARRSSFGAAVGSQWEREGKTRRRRRLRLRRPCAAAAAFNRPSRGWSSAAAAGCRWPNFSHPAAGAAAERAQCRHGTRRRNTVHRSVDRHHTVIHDVAPPRRAGTGRLFFNASVFQNIQLTQVPGSQMF